MFILSSILRQYILNKNQKQIQEYIKDLKEEGNWSLISFVDELVPLLLMECNLKYSNFHLVKMSLFLRELTIKEYFTRKTEKQLIKLMAYNFSEKNLVNIEAKREGIYEEHDSSQIMDKLLKEINKGNSHNAFYYALGMLKHQPEELCHILLKIGSRFISDSLGHSLSCFYPVVRDYIYQDSIHTPTAILSYIMYLCRYNLNDKERASLEKKFNGDYSKNCIPDDYNDLTYRCASGEGIVNLHHMITLAIYFLWKDDEFNFNPSCEELLEWVENKEVNKDQKRMISSLNTNVEIPSTYKKISDSFHLEELDQSLENYFALLKKDPGNAIDWLFRLYTEYYQIGWDPHYFTGLYSAFILYFSSGIDKTAGRMAIYQAIKYFANDI